MKTLLLENTERGDEVPRSVFPIGEEVWDYNSEEVPFNRLPRVMGVLNVTPDSFSDGVSGLWSNVEFAVERAAEMIKQGAHIIDVGGESTRPGSGLVGIEEEIERVVPVIEAISKEHSIPISIDTRRVPVAQHAVEAGASLVNDVAMGRDGLFEMVEQVPYCLMHSRGTFASLDTNTEYVDGVTATVKSELQRSLDEILSTGAPRWNIMIDPGFGFTKTNNQNLQLLKELHELRSFAYPILVGFSRKRFIRNIVENCYGSIPTEESKVSVFSKEVEYKSMLAGGTCATWVALQGADIIRTHDVEETSITLKMLESICNVD